MRNRLAAVRGCRSYFAAADTVPAALGFPSGVANRPSSVPPAAEASDSTTVPMLSRLVSQAWVLPLWASGHLTACSAPVEMASASASAPRSTTAASTNSSDVRRVTLDAPDPGTADP